MALENSELKFLNREKTRMTDPYSVTLSGGAPWGIRISGGREFGTPIILNHIVVNGKAHLGGIKTGTEFSQSDGPTLDLS